MNPPSTLVGILAGCLALVLSATACAEAPPTPTALPAAADTTTPAASPSAAPPSTPTPSPAPAATSSPAPSGKPEAAVVPAPLDAEIGVGSPLEEGWAKIDEKAEESQRAWLEGEIQQGDRLIISTANVRKFRLDLTRLHLDWEKRILLRMDQFNSELTRKRWPEITFERTPSGAWEAVEE